MKITVITVTYNSARTVEDALQSVLRQSYRDYELWVIDGGSTDGTVAILERYEPLFEGRMHWLSEPDRGMYDAMNKGIRRATGEVIGILNSDDFFAAPTILERVAEGLVDESLSAVYGDVHYVDAQDQTKVVRHYSSRFVRPWMLRCGYMPAHPSFYCRKAVYERYGLYDASYPIAADFEWMLRVLLVHRIRTCYLPLDFVSMRVGGASSSGWRSHIQILRDHRRAYRQNGVYSNLLFEGLRYCFKVGELIYFKWWKRSRL